VYCKNASVQSHSYGRKQKIKKVKIHHKFRIYYRCAVKMHQYKIIHGEESRLLKHRMKQVKIHEIIGIFSF
jgi:hypothetical protein